MRRLTAFLVLSLAALPAARAADDYGLANEDWNGLSDLVSIAQGRGLTVESRAALRWSDIGKNDVLVILYPTARLESIHLRAFLRSGGRVLIGDDFGKSGEALAGLGILHEEARRRSGMQVHEGNPNLPIAVAVSEHPLARGVAEIVTNHPSSFRASAGPDVVFSYGGRDEAVVVAGAMGDGRFVALSDPSILINAMLEFDGNLAFAVNLLEFLAPQRPARLLVITGDAELAGEPADTKPEDQRSLSLNQLLTDLSPALEELNDYLASETALRLMGWAAGLSVMVAGAVVLAVRQRRDADPGFARIDGDLQGAERLITELDRDEEGASYGYPAALLRENALEEMEARAAHDGARSPAAKALASLRKLPSRAQVVGQGVVVSRRVFIDAHAEVVAARRAH